MTTIGQYCLKCKGQLSFYKTICIIAKICTALLNLQVIDLIANEPLYIESLIHRQNTMKANYLLYTIHETYDFMEVHQMLVYNTLLIEILSLIINIYTWMTDAHMI